MIIKPNLDQINLLKALMEFWDSDEQYFLISGQAGVGKTYSMKLLVAALARKKNIKICMCGPTNKSTAVLRKSVGEAANIEFRTVHSLLGLKMDTNGEVKELKYGLREAAVGSYGLIILDEASMVGVDLLEYLQSKIVISGTKIVIIGDKEQLPPVKELVSPIWRKFNINYELTEVVRHQNSILTFVQSIRANKDPEFISPGPEVSIVDDTSYLAEIDRLAPTGAFHTGGAKVIAWRNATVDFMNLYIRSRYPLTASDDKYVPGDRVVFREPLIHKIKGGGSILIASTDEEGVIKNIYESHHTIHRKLQVLNLEIQLEEEVVTVAIIHPESEVALKELLQSYAVKKSWGSFWALKESFASITHSYALTAHRSQGSTFPVTLVDAGDIMLNPNISERTKCLYVACSRASSHLHVFP
jgi:exodeoxyribonuclease-5